ncbi:hypothetical protein ALQ55_200147 [Pseudomonas savastanoi pv. savastanoi]|nr:hypothetical protein ALQ55_200147 [Pseudomonas savastanoi pv. savastanoi]RMV94860.1 hypothetical protein ALP01_200293 [Pseudomonas caricapapayae]
MAKQKSNPKRDIEIKLFLPGTDAVEGQPLAHRYEITVTRSDGVAPIGTEAFMILMKCFEGGALDHSMRSAKKQ